MDAREASRLLTPTALPSFPRPQHSSCPLPPSRSPAKKEDEEREKEERRGWASTLCSRALRRYCCAQSSSSTANCPEAKTLFLFLSLYHSIPPPPPSFSVGCAPETWLRQAATPRCNCRRQTCRMWQDFVRFTTVFEVVVASFFTFLSFFL